MAERKTGGIGKIPCAFPDGCNFPSVKVLLVNDYPRGGGAEAHVAALTRRLREAGHQAANLFGEKTRLHALGRLGSPLRTAVAGRAMDEFRPDVVHIHKHNLYWAGAPFRAAMDRGLPVVSTQHDYGGICPEGWMVDREGGECSTGVCGTCWGTRCARSDSVVLDLYRRFNWFRILSQRRLLVRSVSAFTAPSHLLAHWVGRVYSPVPAHTLHSFVEPVEGAAETAKHGIFTAFVASRLEREKGVGIVLEALANLDGIRLRIAGSGKEEAMLKARCHELGIAERVQWLGQIDRKRIATECRAAHVFLQPSHWVEGGGDGTLSVLEAMLEGCPAASTRFGNDPDAIEHGRTGWLVSRGDPDGWTRVLAEAAKSPARCLEMGAQARIRVLAENSPARFLAKITGIYEEAILSRPRS